MSSALITQGAPLQSWRPLMMPWRTMRNAVITLTSMICAPASSFISPRSRALAIDGDGVVAAERANPRLGPAIAASGWLACTIEEPRDLLVWHQARQLADKQQRIIRNRPAMLADPIHLERQRGVVSALPMQDHLDEAAFDSHDDLVQCRAPDPLACRGPPREVAAAGVPGAGHPPRGQGDRHAGHRPGCPAPCRGSRERLGGSPAPPCLHSPHTACGRNGHSAGALREAAPRAAPLL